MTTLTHERKTKGSSLTCGMRGQSVRFCFWWEEETNFINVKASDAVILIIGLLPFIGYLWSCKLPSYSQGLDLCRH